MSVKVSIIIVSWNTRDILLNCLESIFRETSLPIEVIIVDNASDDGSADAVANTYAEVHIVKNASNLGFARANNQGLKQASGEYILFLNPDTIILEDAIGKMIHFIEKNTTPGILGPHTLNADGVSTQNTVIFVPSLSGVFHTHLPFWRLIPGWNPRLAGEVSWRKTGPVEIVKGSCMLLSKNLADHLGGMSEKHFMYSEEYDLCIRAAKLGYSTWYYDEAKIIHLGGQATSQNSPTMVRAMIDAYTDIFTVHNPGASVRLFHFLLAIGSTWRWLAWALLSLIPSKNVVARLRMNEHLSTIRYLCLG
jgi:GT2 family glycosyltransferase